jgi:hypothetical protein
MFGSIGIRFIMVAIDGSATTMATPKKNAGQPAAPAWSGLRPRVKLIVSPSKSGIVVAGVNH